MWKTSQKKGEAMLSKAKCYKNVILHSRHSLLDNISTASAMWRNIAIPGILNATDAIPISNTVIEELEIVQNQIGKALLGVPQCTANTVVQVELGWKPLRLLLELNKLRFFQRVYCEDFKGSELLKTCMMGCLSALGNQYRSNLLDILGNHARFPEELMSILRKQLVQVYEMKVFSPNPGDGHVEATSYSKEMVDSTETCRKQQMVTDISQIQINERGTRK
jgi:hypothetical protein